MSAAPPRNVQAAAAVVNEWLASVEGRKSPEELARMTPAQRLDYARQFDQSKMPAWQDKRAK